MPVCHDSPRVLKRLFCCCGSWRGRPLAQCISAASTPSVIVCVMAFWFLAGQMSGLNVAPIESTVTDSLIRQQAPMSGR